MKYIIIFIALALANFFAVGLDISTINDALERSFFQAVALFLAGILK